MKEYYLLTAELFAIKSIALAAVVKNSKSKAKVFEILFDTGKQLRSDLDQLKTELFANAQLSRAEEKELKKIIDKIMVKYTYIRRKYTKALEVE